MPDPQFDPQASSGQYRNPNYYSSEFYEERPRFRRSYAASPTGAGDYYRDFEARRDDEQDRWLRIALIGGGIMLAAGAVMAVALSNDRLRRRMKNQALRAMPKRLAKVRHTITIDRPRQEVYAFWRNFSNLAQILPYLDRVDYQEGVPMSHWVARGPAGMSVEWDTMMVDDWPGERISWRSVEGTGDIRNHGMLDLADTPDRKGTQATLQMVFDSPLGEAGRALAWMTGRDPGQAARDALHRLKIVLEAGGASHTSV